MHRHIPAHSQACTQLHTLFIDIQRTQRPYRDRVNASLAQLNLGPWRPRNLYMWSCQSHYNGGISGDNPKWPLTWRGRHYASVLRQHEMVAKPTVLVWIPWMRYRIDRIKRDKQTKSMRDCHHQVNIATVVNGREIYWDTLGICSQKPQKLYDQAVLKVIQYRTTEMLTILDAILLFESPVKPSFFFLLWSHQ